MTVRKAVRYLMEKQKQAGGDEGPTKGWFGERMYSQGICTTALAEAYGMKIMATRTRGAAQKGLDYILRYQPNHGGFTYEASPEAYAQEKDKQLAEGSWKDTSVTCFVMQAIKGGISCGLDVPNVAKQRAEAFLVGSLNQDGSTNYTAGSPGGSVSMTAAALTVRLLLGRDRKSSDCVSQATWLLKNDHLKVAREVEGELQGEGEQQTRAAPRANFYSIYYLSLSMFNMQGKLWKQWNKAYSRPLCAFQVKDGPERGSWPHDKSSYGGSGGRVYSTAMACLALEVPFRYSLTE